MVIELLQQSLHRCNHTGMETNQQVRVRIAPSPTGKMHIGTARTALFNKLFALHHNGTYCVRIEDTDKERSTPENIDFIKAAFKWLGLEPDDGSYVLQSQNIEKHKTAAQKLLNSGKAYKDDGAVRFKIPEGHTHWQDLVQGDITYDNKDLEDFVILRSDGTPTYHLGVVVDDAEMGITHIIRGDDHINNTPKQILLHHALGYAAPSFAHIPLIHGPDGSKLSKRHGAASVQDYCDQGYLSAALRHYLMQLSWLPGDAMEPLTLEQAGVQFNISDVKKGPASFDAAKLESINARYLKETPPIMLLALLNPLFKQQGLENTEETTPRVLKGIRGLVDRAKNLVELADMASCYVQSPPFKLDEAAQAILENGQEHIQMLKAELNDATLDGELLHTIIADYVKDHNLKFPMVGKPLRVALTGRVNGQGLADIMVALGRMKR